MYKRVPVTEKRKKSGCPRRIWVADVPPGEDLEFDVIDETRNGKVLYSGVIPSSQLMSSGSDRFRIGFLHRIPFVAGWSFKPDIGPT